MELMAELQPFWDLPLDRNKTLKSLTLKTIANDVVIGLMSTTLIR
jgi:hypothetical protein